ncbi:MAG: GDSL-type esterase/lipase family protein [Tannerella sp.]|jgi:lysophospholipase L1-like esterase|nr:GDSL-type esterase/lipase family protein [Tannerella sp.]
MTARNGLWNGKRIDMMNGFLKYIFGGKKLTALKAVLLLAGLGVVLTSAGFDRVCNDETESILGSADTLKFPFINDALCRISDPRNSLASFRKALTDLKNGKDTVINIIHLGDSHIQAGYLSGRTMRLLQSSFGNAGRGWIAPFRLSRQNEPPDYFISSNVNRWTSGRCVQLKPRCPWGPGGIGIQTETQPVNFKLIIAPLNGAGYSFNKALLFRDANAAAMEPSAASKDFVSDLLIGKEPYENIVADTFITSYHVDTLQIKSIGQRKSGARNLYYGFNLMNGNPGLLYHAIGVNGAKYADFTSRSYVRQLSLLKPSLFIISLGTNESFGKNFSESEFEAQINSFIKLVREEMPQAILLITTPIETFKRQYKNKKRYYVRNENMVRVANVIREYSDKEGIASFDMFAVGGGENSCEQWLAAGMLGRDHIHFSREAYGEQGALLYKALMRNYLRPDTWRFQPVLPPEWFGKPNGGFTLNKTVGETSQYIERKEVSYDE